AAAVTCGLLLAIAGPAAAMIPPLAGRPGQLRTDARLATAARTAAPAYFHTLKPGTKLPSAAQCASWVLARPAAENKGVNRRFNAATGHQVGQHFFAGDKPQANRWIAPRINGNFKGTTKQILRWAACKWGIDQNMAFAQAAVESWWREKRYIGKLPRAMMARRRGRSPSPRSF
ncbi:MAG TPA: hypothetical protein VF951_15440, partial [Streptosporangiaceae bacterium]